MRIPRPPIKLLALLAPGAMGYLVYFAGAWIVYHDSVNYRLDDAGFGFVSNAAEMIFAAGPVVCVGAALVLALPSILSTLGQVGPVWKAVTLNIVASIAFVCGLGCMGILFAGVLAVAPFLWVTAMLWAVTRESNQHLQPIPR